MPTTISIGTDGGIAVFDGQLTMDTDFGIIPEFEEYAEEAPGYPGRYVSGVNPKTRDLTLVFRVTKAWALQAAYIRSLAALINPSLGEMILQDQNDSGKQLMVYAGKPSYKRRHSGLVVSLPLVGRPYWESTTTHTLDNSGTAANAGNAPCPCTITFAAGTDPSITIGGTTVSYTGTIAVGSKVEVDTLHKTAAYINIGSGARANALANVAVTIGGASTEDWPWLAVGNNTVTTAATTQISWQDWWI